MQAASRQQSALRHPPQPNETGNASTESTYPKIHCVSQIVIPARLNSSRLPRKLLLRETGKTVLQHTYESVCAAQLPTGIIVAVDCQELFDEVVSFGGRAILTDPTLPSGTDRVAEVARQIPEVDIFVNVQADEPEIEPAAVDQVISLLAARPSASVATLAAPIREAERLADPACVKLVTDHQSRALYFSRSPIPHARSWHDDMLWQDPPLFWQHIGIYAYRRDFLTQLHELPVSPLEETEKLEQLRFLQAGHEIVVARTEHPFKGIDTARDYREFVSRQFRLYPQH